MSQSQQKLRKIHIEISNICNLQCSFCPEVEREKKEMDEVLFSRLIREAKPLTEEVCLHVMGEPLAHPKFSRFVEISSALNVPLNIVTNGTLLNEEKTTTLLNPTVRQVNFSLQSFLDNFPGKDPSTYLEKIFSFTRKAFLERPDLYINYRLWNLDSEQMSNNQNEFIFKKIEEEFSITINRNVDVKQIKSKKLLNRLYLHFDSRFQWPNPQSPIRGDKGFCHALSTHIAIHANGTVVPCCLDKEASTKLGSTQETPLQEILLNKRTQKMKQGFKD